MPNKRTTPLAIAAGLAFIAEAAAELAHRQADHFSSTGDYVVEGLFALALTLAALAFVAIRNEVATTGGGRGGAAAGAAGQGALAACSIATIIHGGDALGPVFMLGLLASVIGPILLAVRDVRCRRIGIAVALGFIASSAIPQGGAAIVGLAWIAVALLVHNGDVVATSRGRATA